MNSSEKCAFVSCERNVTAKALCMGHYMQIRDGKELTALRPRKRTDPAQRFWSYVDKTSTCWEWTGTKDPLGYGRMYYEDKYVGAHRISLMIRGDLLSSEDYVDHLCHNPSCVRPNHLRVGTPKQNSENRAGASVASKSNVRGVSWEAGSRRWRGSVGHLGRTHHTASFSSLAEASEAVVALRSSLYGPDYAQLPGE